MPDAATVTVQVHVDGRWRDAATVTFLQPDRGIAGRTRVVYDDAYFGDQAAIDFAAGVPAIDRRAVSVRMPVNLETYHLPAWPAFLLDLMPQGLARARLARTMDLHPNLPESELPLLLRAAGSPVGNLRIRESHVAEHERIAEADCPPLTDADIATRSGRFRDVVNRFILIASGSTGVQGEWPKALMTRRASDGVWFPDPFVATGEASEHAIVKLLRSSAPSDRLILESEVPYLRVAEMFGLTVAVHLQYHDGILMIPRFDREVGTDGVVLHGQESLVSALGVAEFGYLGYHEDYLTVIREASDNPAADVTEYVLRDLLSAAMGNSDNHGRNAALRKNAAGGIRLAPLFDFAPMRLSAAAVGRSTRWRCLGGCDHDPDWRLICDSAATAGGVPRADLRRVLVGKIEFLHELPTIARECGVHPDVVERACSRHEEIARALGSGLITSN